MSDVYKQYINYESYGEIVQTLSHKLKTALVGVKVTHVYGPPRGGLPLAVHLSHELDIPLVLDLDTQLYAGDSKLLIVDDVCDSGKTLTMLTTDLKDRGVDIVAIATLHAKPRATFEPDIVINKVPDNCWLVYPWEGSDDIVDKEYMDKLEDDIDWEQSTENTGCYGTTKVENDIRSGDSENKYDLRQLS